MLDRLFRRPPPAVAPPSLSVEQVARWNAEGFLVLRDFLSAREIAAVRAAVDDEWTSAPGNDHEVDVLTGPHSPRTFKIGEAPRDVRADAYKLNNLFARRADIRAIALAPRLRAVCAALLEGEPLVCNSLNFERGSQQPFHIDTWYMPPPVDNRMVAAWIAVDDVDASNGPLVYYPGSHLIPAYRFSDGRLNEIASEVPRCREYLEREIEARGLKEVEFHGRSGDVFIWHAQLLNGGRPIRDMSRTRGSMVVHYWRAGDVPAQHVRGDASAGRYLGYTLRGEIEF
jgi:phytanoyl-CoA hydroxylase